jgi:hypothetical protein
MFFVFASKIFEDEIRLLLFVARGPNFGMIWRKTISPELATLDLQHGVWAK